MKYIGISSQIFDTTQKMTAAQQQKIEKALVAAAYAMRNNARKQFTHNGHGYDISSLQDGILLGSLRVADGVSSITIHAMGDSSIPKTWKARIFAGGAYHRRTKGKGRNRGTIEDLKTITKALNQNILDTYINNVIK